MHGIIRGLLVGTAPYLSIYITPACRRHQRLQVGGTGWGPCGGARWSPRAGMPRIIASRYRVEV